MRTYRTRELSQMTLEHIEDSGASLMKTAYNGGFVVSRPEILWKLYPFVRQLQKIAAFITGITIKKIIAIFLKLANRNSYTGHAF